ncbi:MAG: epoxyqueuosine reductase [Clostridiales bacterium]|nr:epoxyqueuosine reductase [Clostridiales bacterium]
MSTMSSQTFSAWAKELGFAEIGFCLPKAFSSSRRIVESQEPLRERKQLRFCPQEDYPQIKSIAVLLWPYDPSVFDSGEHVFVDSYYAASNAAYHAASTLEQRVLASGSFAKANVSYPAKEAAIRAGMGVIGKNSLLITPSHGSRVVIILIATDIEDYPSARDSYDTGTVSCLDCGRCAKACPVGAIDSGGIRHPEKCLRNYMMEGVAVPEALREKMGMRLIGCDLCQRACPMQPTPVKRVSGNVYALSDFMKESPADFSASVSRLCEEIGRNAARPQRIRAQAAILAGNSKNPAYLPVLRVWSEMPFDAVQQHARWAIRQIELADMNT